MNLIGKIVSCGLVVMATSYGLLAAELQKATPTAAPGAPAMFTPVVGGTNAMGRSSPFSAEISADFIKKVMETSAKIESAKNKISARQAQLYESDPEIKSTRAQMVKLQKEINHILDADHELAELKISRDLLWSTMPAMPQGKNPASMPRRPMAQSAPVIR